MEDFLNQLVIPIALGGTAWITAEFFGRQLVRFRAVRAEAIEVMYFYANVIPENEDRQKAGRAELRRCAARLEAIRIDASWVTRIAIKLARYDIDTAVQNLTGLSNSLVDRNSSDKHRTAVERALRVGRRS